jgi:GTP cyclohydrolase I
MKINGNGYDFLTKEKTNGNHTAYTTEELHHDHDALGEDHIATSLDTPLRDDAFALTDEIKQEIIEEHFEKIMQALGLDLRDDSLKGTPKRMAKMYVKEIFSGLDPRNKPSISLFDNKYKYDQMLVEKHIHVSSTCEHHFLPITGKAHVAYISSGKVIGLSKINRIVDFYSRRPQVQERLTVQIANELKKALNTPDVAVVIEAKHMCVSCRGIEDDGSTTLTAEYTGRFREENYREEFLRYINLDLKK